MRKLLFLLLAISPTIAVGQSTVTNAEYFFNTDPGFGNGTAIAIATPSDSVHLNLNIPILSLPDGLHTLYVRVKNNFGQWSQYENRIFYKSSSPITTKVDAAEYFINTDPGYGMGTPLPVGTASDSIYYTGNINISALSPGTHLLYVRTKNDLGKWSPHDVRLFYKSGSPVMTKVNAAEYFFNIDPGFGMGTPLPIGAASDSIYYSGNINIATLGQGAHLLYVRTRNDHGKWSPHDARLFYIHDTTKAQDIKIVKAEYFFDADPGVGQATPLTVTPDHEILFSDTINPVLTLGEHYLFVRVLDDRGNWGMYDPQKIKICTTYGPEPAFDPKIDRHQIFLNNTSQYFDQVFWEFGDGKTENLQINPSHIYEVGGYYNVELTLTNVCGVDSIVKPVEINGLGEIHPNVSGKTNYLSAIIRGAGLTPQTTIVLTAPSKPDIIPDTIIFIDSSALKVNFKFSGAQTGDYNVIADIPGSWSDTLFNEFRIEENGEFEGWVDILGPSSVRWNRTEPYKFSIIAGNSGNITGYGVPVYILLPSNVEVKLLNILIIADSIEQAMLDTTQRFKVVVDSLTGDSMWLGAFMLPSIEPFSFATIDITLKTFDYDLINLEAYIGPPMLDSANLAALGLRSSCNFLPPCMQCMMDLAGFAPGPLGCLSGAANLGCSIGNYINNKDPLDPLNNQKLALDILLNTASLGLKCLGAGSALSAMEKKIMTGLGFGGKALTGTGLLKPCFDCIPKPGGKNIKPVNSTDPNIKEGPSGFTSDNYIRGDQPLFYSIYFENVDTATAPAAEVTISDQLDTVMLDLSSFEFVEFGFGDTSYYLENLKYSFTQDVDLRPAKNLIVRIEGNLDTISGMVNWKFTSFDPDTMVLVADPFGGFLPPNLNSPQGEGVVRYKINLRPGYQHLDITENKADIIFDYNAPLATPVWKNTIDMQKPQSAVITLQSIQNDTIFTIKWAGTDPHSGIMGYDIYYSVNDSAYQLLLSNTDLDSVVFIGKDGDKYEFYSIARDNVLNIEDPPANPAFNPDASTTVQLPVGIENPLKESELWLDQNKPNPFSLITKIDFFIPRTSEVRLEVYDHSGRLVKVLMDQRLQRGNYHYTYEADGLESGIYFLKLYTPQGSVVKKMVLMR